MTQSSMFAQVAPPRIKVCGVTQLDQLDWISVAGADAVGINLVPSSKRFVGLEMAARLSQHAQALGLKSVAVLMNPDSNQISDAILASRWDFIQLHGIEDPALVADFIDANATGRIAIIKAVSWSGRREEVELVERWAHWSETLASQEVSSHSKGVLAGPLAGFLIDAYAPEEGGGTGRIANWNLICPRPELFRNVPVLLAGGLTPANVRQAILETKCDGVDVASGVELEPGRKSPELVADFVRQAARTFAETAVSPLPPSTQFE